MTDKRPAATGLQQQSLQASAKMPIFVSTGGEAPVPFHPGGITASTANGKQEITINHFDKTRNMEWKKLQNGSDIRGIALDGTEGERVNLTADATATIARAFVKWLQTRTPSSPVSIAVGMDSRLSGPALKQAFIAGATAAGAHVRDCGMASTPAMFMSTVAPSDSTTAGVMITASHLPWNRNGLKFFTHNGGLDKADIAAILGMAETEPLPDAPARGTVSTHNLMETYCRQLADYIRQGVQATDYDHPLKDMRIVVDAGNGAGGFFAGKVLEPLGADTRGSQFLEPDGTFPNHVPNPENREAMQSVCQAVMKNHADLGIIFDTDVDRSAIVDSSGQPINRNALIALIAAVILREHPGTTIVTDSVTSDGLAAFISEAGGKHHRYMRGYKNVINEAVRLNDNGQESWLAIETSGHAALKENYFLDDGAFLVAKLLVEAARLNAQGKTLDSLIARLRMPAESREIRFNIATEDFKNYGQKVLAQLTETVNGQADYELTEPNYEGVRVRCLAADECGWFLLRLSLHDPVMVLNIESDVAGGTQRIENKLRTMLSAFDKLHS